MNIPKATLDRVIDISAMLAPLRDAVKRNNLALENGTLNDKGKLFAHRDSMNCEAQIEAALDGIIDLLCVELRRPRDAMIVFVNSLEEMGLGDDDTPIGGADMVDFICQEYPNLKESLR